MFFKISYLILILSTICIMFLFSNSILLNFTIICMNKKTINKNDYFNQSTTFQQKHKNEFSAIERSVLFSLPALGSIIGGLLINPLINKFNIRYTITGFCLISALSTLLFPFGYKFLGFWALCFLRILQGTCFPAEYVTISIVSRKWAPIKSISTFLVLSSTHFQIGPLLTMPTAGYFCESNFGWEGIYYLMSILTIILTILFFLIFRDCPSEHPWISEKELKQIEFGKYNNLEEEKKKEIPYYKIITDWSIWLLIMAFISDEIAFQLFTEMGPYYLNKVLKISISGTGYLAAIPYILSLITKILSGPINDKLLSKILSEQFRIKLFAAISQYGIFVSMAGLAFFPNITSSLWIILPFYALINVFTGLDFLGIFRYSQFISVKYSEFIISWLNIIMSIVSLALPGIVALVAPDDTIKQWTFIFLIISLIVFISITIFTLFAKTSQRKWALETNNNNNNTITKDETEVIEKNLKKSRKFNFYF